MSQYDTLEQKAVALKYDETQNLSLIHIYLIDVGNIIGLEVICHLIRDCLLYTSRCV